MVPRPSNFEAKLTKKRPQTDQNSTKKLISILIPFLMDFGTNLGRFWEGFGGQVGAMLAPNAIKTRPQNQSKNECFLESLWVDFEWILAPNMAPKGRNFYLQISTFLALGAILAPRRPQDAPRSPKRRPRQPPRPILEPFWWIFG